MVFVTKGNLLHCFLFAFIRLMPVAVLLRHSFVAAVVEYFHFIISFYAYLFVTLHPEKSNKADCVLKDRSCDAYTCFLGM